MVFCFIMPMFYLHRLKYFSNLWSTRLIWKRFTCRLFPSDYDGGFKIVKPMLWLQKRYNTCYTEKKKRKRAECCVEMKPPIWIGHRELQGVYSLLNTPPHTQKNAATLIHAHYCFSRLVRFKYASNIREKFFGWYIWHYGQYTTVQTTSVYFVISWYQS